MRIKYLWQRPFWFQPTNIVLCIFLHSDILSYSRQFETNLHTQGQFVWLKYAMLMHRDKKFRIFQAKCSHYPIRHIPCFRFVVFVPGLFNSRSIALYFIHQTSCNWCLCFTTLDFKVKLYCGVKKLSLIIRESLLELHIASLVCRLFCFCFCFFFCFVL